jgi:proteic killer suppression protein
MYATHHQRMIKSFADKRTAALFQGLVAKGTPPDVARRATAKLRLIDAAAELSFLESPPGNRLEALGGDRAGQHSIRVNEPVAPLLPLVRRGRLRR